MSSIKKTIYLISAMSLVFMFTFFGLFVQNQDDVCYAMGILFMTVSYHFIIRLVIGTLVDAAFDNRIDSSKSWFEDSDAERAFYRLIGVRKWKKKIPTYDNAAFSMKKHSLEDIIGASCQAEIVHEINILASLASILFAIPFGVMWVFILTSIAGALFDLVFVIVQRYNRPRLIRAAERQRRIFFEKLAYEEAIEENADRSNSVEEINGEDEPDPETEKPLQEDAEPAEIPHDDEPDKKNDTEDAK